MGRVDPCFHEVSARPASPQDSTATAAGAEAKVDARCKVGAEARMGPSGGPTWGPALQGSEGVRREGRT